MLTPYQGVTYNRKVIHKSAGELVEFMLIFSCMDKDGYVIIDDYVIRTLQLISFLEGNELGSLSLFEVSFQKADEFNYFI